MRTTLAVLALLSVTAVASAADDVISWEDADKHVGEEATVEGRVVDVHCSQLSCLLAFEPSFNRFTAVVQARSFDVFPPDALAGRYQGKLVQVHGKIETRDSKPEIIIEKPDDIALAGAKPRAQKAAESAARDAAETAQRMADVLERVEELTERMAAVQERMETLLTELEQRDAALAAAAQASQPPPPPAPSYGEPQPRPAYEALRTVKRGMSRTEVQRLVGVPEYVENGGGGWTTWYYGYGRSVSFDARGRVQAFVGFPAP